MKHGLCRQVDAELFFVDATRERDVIETCCKPCPVRHDCLDYAVNFPDPVYGVWGGLPEVAIARLRAAKGLTAGAPLRRERDISDVA
jgi:WhiB family redox-sensing transcriptional regulator